MVTTYLTQQVASISLKQLQLYSESVIYSYSIVLHSPVLHSPLVGYTSEENQDCKITKKDKVRRKKSMLQGSVVCMCIIDQLKP